MSPAKKPTRPRGRSRRKRSAGVTAAFVLMGVIAAAAAGLAMYLGFVPGPDSWLGRASAVAPIDTLADTLASTATPTDSAATATATPAPTSASVPIAPDATVLASDSAAGDAVYRGDGRCIGCHGAVGEGVPGLGPTLQSTRTGDGSVATIARIVTAGAPLSGAYRIAMPSYSGQLAPDAIMRVAAYVFALSHPGSTVRDSVPAAGAPADGAVNADASPAPAARPVRPTVPPPPTTGAGRRP